MSRKYLLRTLGCKVNQYESQQLRETLDSLGLRGALPGETADLAVVNSCAVTASASAKTRQAVRRQAAGGKTPVVVIGCGAAADKERLASIPGVVGLFSHEDDAVEALRHIVVHRLETFSDRSEAADPGDTRRTGGDDGWVGSGSSEPTTQDADQLTRLSVATSSTDVNVVHDLARTIRRFDGHQRAFLKVQDGCDAHCTYCIIPRLRPTLRSKSIESAVAEAKSLVAAGHREIVLTGIYLGAYQRPTALRRRFDTADGSSALAELVGAIAEVDGLVRLRISSLEPGDVNQHLLDVLATNESCVPHLHLPLQAGSSRILKRMNRQYDADDFREMIDRTRDALDRPAISTDIVVGFPGETDQDFLETLEVAKYAGFCKIHAFPFSPREKTAAARWTKEFVQPSLVRERMQQLRELEQELAATFEQQFVGTTQRLLVEKNERPVSGESGVARGRSDRYFEVIFEPDQRNPSNPGDVVLVQIDRVSPRRVHGTLAQPSASSLSLPVMSTHG